MIRIQQLKIRIPHSEVQLQKSIQKALHLQAEDFTYTIVRQSLDARKKPELYYVYTVDIQLKNKSLSEQKIIKRCHHRQIAIVKPESYQFPASGDEPLSDRPVIVGMGPAGLFCGLMLARHGYRPILLERGQSVEQRQLDVERFWSGGKLNPESNVQFGEGGAGTFSDGKLNTLVKDAKCRNRKVLEEFVKAGAKEEILYQNKPHIGTDMLKKIVRNMRTEIEELGGEVRFGTRVDGLSVEENAGIRHLRGVVTSDGQEIPAQVVVLAIGHSARDTFAMLEKLKVPMQAKAFAVGVRVEHSQKMINLSQYGAENVETLGAADYKLTAKSRDGRGVYSFCMCPGGYVVNASSEAGRLAVNGMSYSKRDGEHANSAVVVTVSPEDFEGEGALAGMEFQRKLEERAYEQGQGGVPVQNFGDFRNDAASVKLVKEPQIKGQYRAANVRAIFPEEISRAIVEGMEQFDGKIHGFASDDCLVSGVESRTSSPVRIWRNEEFESEVSGLYPCGEGAGYAGGITSAAMDGIKVAEAIAKKYRML